MNNRRGVAHTVALVLSAAGLTLLTAFVIKTLTRRASTALPPALIRPSSSPNAVPVTLAVMSPGAAPPATSAVNRATVWFVLAAMICAAAGWTLKSSPQPALNPWGIPLFVSSVGLLVAPVVIRVRRGASVTWPNWTWQALGLGATVTAALYAADVNFNAGDLNVEVGSTLIWIMAVVVAVVIAWQRGEKSPGIDWPVTRREAIGLALIVLLAVALRIFDLDRIPYAIMGDETKYGLVSRHLVEHQIVKPFTTGMDGHWYLYYLITGTFIKVLGSSAEALRLPSALAGTLTVLAAYAVARQLWGRHVALIAAALLATCSHNIHFSRAGLNSSYDPLFSMLIFGWLWLAWRSGRRNAWLLTAVAAGLSQYFFVGGRLVLIQAGLLGVFWLVTDRHRLRSQALNIALAVAVFLVLVTPAVYYAAIRPDEYFGALNSKNIYQSGWLAATMKTQNLSEIEVLFKQAQDVWGVFVIRSVASFYWQQAVLIPVMAVLAILGLVYLAGRIRAGPSFWLLSSLALVLLFGGLLTIAPQAGGHRLLGADPLIYLAVAVLLDRGFQLIEQWLHRPRLVAAIGTVVVAGLMLADAQYYFTGYIGDNELTSPEIGGNLVFRFLIEAYHEWGDQPLDVACVGYNADFCSGSRLRYFAPQLLEQSMVVDDLTGVASVPPAAGRPQIVVINAALAHEVEYARQRYSPVKPRNHYGPRGGLVFVSFEIPPPVAATDTGRH